MSAKEQTECLVECGSGSGHYHSVDLHLLDTPEEYAKHNDHDRHFGLMPIEVLNDVMIEALELAGYRYEETTAVHTGRDKWRIWWTEANSIHMEIQDFNEHIRSFASARQVPCWNQKYEEVTE